MGKGKMGLVYSKPGNRTRIRSRDELAAYNQSDEAGISNGSSCRESMNKRAGHYDEFEESMRPHLGESNYD